MRQACNVQGGYFVTDKDAFSEDRRFMIDVNDTQAVGIDIEDGVIRVCVDGCCVLRVNRITHPITINDTRLGVRTLREGEEITTIEVAMPPTDEEIAEFLARKLEFGERYSLEGKTVTLVKSLETKEE